MSYIVILMSLQTIYSINYRGSEHSRPLLDQNFEKFVDPPNLVPKASVWGRGETRGSPGLGRSRVYPKNGSIWQLLVKEWRDIL
jgi:hypothetical protein